MKRSLVIVGLLLMVVVYSGWIEEDIDFVGRFETLQEDFNTVCDKINIPQSVLNHKMTTEHIHYTDEYNEKAKKKIARLFASDIKQFNYKF